MSLENFFGFDAGEGMSEAAFEAFKEQMKAAAAQIAQIRKDEKRQKQKEDELLKILFHYVKTSDKKQLVLLIARALEQNIPASFILAVILLGNDDVVAQMHNFLLLHQGSAEGGADPGANANGGADADDAANEKALTFFREDESLPLKVKIELDKWVKEMMAQAEQYPQKLLATAFAVEYIDLGEDEDSPFGQKKYEKRESIQPALIELTSYVAGEFLEGKKIDTGTQNIRSFAEFLLNGILTKTRESLEGRKMLGDKK